MMYGDHELNAGIIRGGYGTVRLGYGVSGVEVVENTRGGRKLTVPYERFVMLDYIPDVTIHSVDQAAFAKLLPAAADIRAYGPEHYGSTPGPDAIVCTMLERSIRPSYCH